MKSILYSSILRWAVGALHGLVVIPILFLSASLPARSEGSKSWGVNANYQANLMVPTITTINSVPGGGNTGYRDRGFMLLPSDIDNVPNSLVNVTDKATYKTSYRADHRLYVWVKPGETVFWGFHQNGNNAQNTTFRWYYDTNPSTGLGYYPSATSSANGRTAVPGAVPTFNVRGSTGEQGKPHNAAAVLNGPTQVTGSGYNARSFTNTTGVARAFWLEVEFGNTTQGSNSTEYREFDFWDITVASPKNGGGFQAENGRVYCKYWSVVNALPNQLGSSNSNGQSFPSGSPGFGFYIPIDNDRTTLNDFFVKYASFAGSNAGYVVFFANSDGPGTSGTAEQKRRSKTGTSGVVKYPLFLSNPDESVWPSSLIPDWNVSAVFSKRAFPDQGGLGKFTVNASSAGVVDILLDLNNNGVYDVGTDILLNHEFTAAGTHVFDWNGKYANNGDVPVNTTFKVISSMAFFPVHFPIYDMEQSLGIAIRHMRPGTPYDDVLYWDDVNITGYSPTSSPKSVITNTTGVSGREHKWHANGDNGFSQNNTINTWTGAFNKRSEFVFVFKYDSEVDLTVVKKISKPDGELKDIETAGSGETIIFTIVAKNLAIEGQQEVTATGVHVRDILPAGYQFVSQQLSKGAWDSGNNDWIIGDLAVNEEATMTIEAIVKGSGPYINTAEVRGNESEKDDTNNKDDATLKTFDVVGNVFHDPDAGSVGISAAGGINTIPAGVVATLIDGSGKVVGSSSVSAEEIDRGAFSFKTIPGGNYRVILGNASLVPGTTPGTRPLTLPSEWINTGDYIGLPNTGTNAESVNGESEAFEVVDNVENVNFGIQKAPETHDSHYSLAGDPASGITIPLNGTVPAKDGLTVDEISNSDIDGQPTILIITKLAEPIALVNGRRTEMAEGETGPVLYYGANPVVLNQPILNFNASNLSVKLFGTGYVGATFQFQVIDNGGASSNISSYTIDWINFLPVKWVSVDVKKENTSAVVSWSTAEEKNVASFLVHHSVDGKSWSTVGTQKPNNIPLARYQFTHSPGSLGTNYYRIESIDFDGSNSFSQIVSLSMGRTSSLVLHPNPVVSGVLRISSEEETSKISVLTIAGLEVARAKPNQKVVDVANLPTGTYLLQVIYKDGSRTSKTFVIK